MKDRAALLWCENATLLTGTEWLYKKVMQKEFEKLRPDEFEDLIALEPDRGAFVKIDLNGKRKNHPRRCESILCSR